MIVGMMVGTPSADVPLSQPFSIVSTSSKDVCLRSAVEVLSSNLSAAPSLMGNLYVRTGQGYVSGLNAYFTSNANAGTTFWGTTMRHKQLRESLFSPSGENLSAQGFVRTYFRELAALGIVGTVGILIAAFGLAVGSFAISLGGIVLLVTLAAALIEFGAGSGPRIDTR